MLSRVADSIYWLNRYIERAENIARFVEVNLNLMLDMPPGVMGMVSLRGTMLPVIDLASFCGMDVEQEPDKLIITEFNKTTQGMLVQSVEQIIRMEWNDIRVPPAMMAHQMGGW